MKSILRQIYSKLEFTGLALLLIIAMAMPAQAQAPAKNQVSYTCSMHPEIHSPTPGKCPKCGMALVKEKAKPAKAKPEPKKKGTGTKSGACKR